MFCHYLLIVSHSRLQYNFGKKKFLRIDYRGQNDQPSVNQLQPVKNNSNPLVSPIW